MERTSALNAPPFPIVMNPSRFKIMRSMALLFFIVLLLILPNQKPWLSILNDLQADDPGPFKILLSLAFPIFFLSLLYLPQLTTRITLDEDSITFKNIFCKKTQCFLNTIARIKLISTGYDRVLVIIPDETTWRGRNSISTGMLTSQDRAILDEFLKEKMISK